MSIGIPNPFVLLQKDTKVNTTLFTKEQMTECGLGFYSVIESFYSALYSIDATC